MGVYTQKSGLINPPLNVVPPPPDANYDRAIHFNPIACFHPM